MNLKWKFIIPGVLLILLACFLFFHSQPSVPEYERIAREVAGRHVYDKENFNCGDFSEELIQELQAAGYMARIETSEDSKSGRCLFNPEWFKEEFGKELFCHAWVIIEIPIEATTGEIISMEKYLEEY